MKPFYFVCLALIFLSSCTPLRVVRLAPVEETGEYSYGQQLVRKTASAAEVTVSYYDASPSYLVFNVSVENRGDRPINFDPVSCSLVPDVGTEQRAIDPEFQLLAMDIEQMRQTRKNRTMAWVGAGLMVAGAVAGATIDAGEGVANIGLAEELALTVVDATAFAVVQSVANSNARNNAPLEEIPVPESRFFWLDHSLRITTIQPGEVAFGKVVFPRNDEASKFSFRTEVDGVFFEVPFNQQVFR
ncbi:MAG: hypothetical protein AAF597_08805 [Bacteroidota bacterium]